ncbi:MAG: ABC transporter permease [Bacillota bacterium]|jgi:peptide/nickel transport system permease protein
MMRFLVRRLLAVLPTLIGVTIIAFLILHLTPGDPARLIGGPDATEADLQTIRIQLGLDQPLLVQYWEFISGLFTGDLGESWYMRVPVNQLISEALPRSLELIVAAMILATVIGVLCGVIAAKWRNSIIDRLTMLGAMVGISMPNFWLGQLLILWISVKLGWLPVSGLGNNPWSIDGLRHLILPAVAAAVPSAAYLARLTRSTMLEIMRQDYIRTARAKGLAEAIVLLKHALRNTLIPVVTLIGMQFGSLLGEAVIVETVFAWPGLGRLIINATFSRDFPVVQGGVVVIAVAFIIINILVDISYKFLDPKVSLDK